MAPPFLPGLFIFKVDATCLLRPLKLHIASNCKGEVVEITFSTKFLMYVEKLLGYAQNCIHVKF